MDRIILLLLIAGIPWIASAQSIDGRTVDATTGEVVPFVSIAPPGGGAGTISDQDGKFAVVPQSDSLVFTHVSYEPQTHAVTDLAGRPTIELARRTHTLGEVSVVVRDPFSILQQAVQRIDENYRADPLTLVAFQRESVVANGALRMIQEVAYHALNRYDRDVLPGQIRVLKARAWGDPTILYNLGRVVQQGIGFREFQPRDDARVSFAFPTSDWVSDDPDDFLGSQGPRHYDYTLHGVERRNGQSVYHIGFEPRPDSRSAWLEGDIHVHTEDYAFAALSVRAVGDAVYQDMVPARYRLLARLGGYRIDVRDLAFSVEFVPVGGSWILRSFHQELGGSVQKRRRTPVDGTYVLDVEVFDVLDKTRFYNVRSEYDSLLSNIKPFWEPDFWGDLDVIDVPGHLRDVYPAARPSSERDAPPSPRDR